MYVCIFHSNHDTLDQVCLYRVHMVVMLKVKQKFDPRR